MNGNMINNHNYQCYNKHKHHYLNKQIHIQYNKINKMIIKHNNKY